MFLRLFLGFFRTSSSFNLEVCSNVHKLFAMVFQGSVCDFGDPQDHPPGMSKEPWHPVDVNFQDLLRLTPLLCITSALQEQLHVFSGECNKQSCLALLHAFADMEQCKLAIRTVMTISVPKGYIHTCLRTPMNLPVSMLSHEFA
jgi:hypothetical protein